MRSTFIAGLDIGTTRTSAVIGELVGESGRLPTLEVRGVGQSRTSGLRGEAVTNIEETTESVRAAMAEAELMAGAQVDRVYAGIAGDHVRAMASLGVVAVEGEEVAPLDVHRVHDVARAVAFPPDRELLHAIPVEYTVDGREGIRDPVGMAATRLESDVYLMTCDAAEAANIRKAVSRAGYGVQELVLEALASARSVLTEDEKEVGAAMVEIGGSTTGVAAYHEGRLRKVSVLPVGGTTVTTDLVRGLSLPFAEANRAKETWGAALARLVDPQETVDVPGPAPGQTRHLARELIAHVVEQRMDEILSLVREELEADGLLPDLGAGIVLTGGATALPGLVELAQQVFASPVRLGVPGEGLAGLAESVGRPRFACAVGLALYGSDRWVETGEGATTLTSGLVTRIGAWLREFF
jgi:cell division protein FtsA